MTATFPQLLQQHARQRPQAPALREKEFGIWQTWSWQRALDDTRHMALGLASLGFVAGQNLAVVGDNRPLLYLMFVSVQSLGGVPVPMYQDAVAAEMAFVLRETGAHFAFAEDQEQVDKLLELRAGEGEAAVPGLDHIIYDDPRGLRHYRDAGLISVQDLMERGRQFERQHPQYFEQQLARIKPDDTAIILYTSGTTSRPKGVCQTHQAYIAAAEGGVAVDKLNGSDNVLSYLPPAWAGDFLFSVAQWLVAGFTINCPESAETVAIDMREIGPTYYFAPPRVFESMLTSVSIRMEDAAPIKQWMHRKFMEVARRVGADILVGKPVALGGRLLYGLGNLLVYGPLKNAMGLSRIRVAYTAGAAIGPDLFRFFRSIGVNLKQLYGQTETCAYVCLQKDGQVKLDTVGQAAPGVELKIAEGGEVLVRSQSLLTEYYKRPEATAEVLDAEGFFHTGDAGVIDSDGAFKRIANGGDPYPQRCEASAAAIAAALDLSPSDWTLTYQSRFGKERWLEPATDKTLDAMAARGLRQVDVVCPGFAVDCLETLEEVAMQFAEHFAAYGGQLRYIPCLNASDAHAAALSALVSRAAGLAT